MRILFLATKPPWPPIDGGRVLMRNTLESLVERGHRVTVVAPGGRPTPKAGGPAALPSATGGVEDRSVAARLRPLLVAALRTLLTGRPLSVERHALRRVRNQVATLLASGSFDIVHAEQVQALAQARPAFDISLPVVLRAQNVESDLWSDTALLLPFRRFVARREARSMARYEGDAVARATAAVALTERDAQRLALLAGGRGQVSVVPAPFPAVLPEGRRRLPGTPAVVLMASRGWLPNHDACRWFVRAIWPEVRKALPDGHLHVFGQGTRRGSGAGITFHPAPVESREAFPPGAVLLVPLRLASGVRIKILEAWARGLPVVATPEAAAGLEAEDGRELMICRDAADFITALGRLAAEPDLAAHLTAAGRALLARRHDPRATARQLESAYSYACQMKGRG